MVEIAYVINDVRAGKTYQKKLEGNLFEGKKIGETVQGAALGLLGYELRVTGGSDYVGFPLLKNIEGAGRKKVLLKKGTAAKKKIKRKGMTIRRIVVGNTISSTTRQVNLKVTKYGTKQVTELLGIQPQEGEAKAESKTEARQATAKEEAKEKKEEEHAKAKK